MDVRVVPFNLMRTNAELNSIASKEQIIFSENNSEVVYVHDGVAVNIPVGKEIVTLPQATSPGDWNNSITNYERNKFYLMRVGTTQSTGAPYNSGFKITTFRDDNDDFFSKQTIEYPISGLIFTRFWNVSDNAWGVFRLTSGVFPASVEPDFKYSGLEVFNINTKKTIIYYGNAWYDANGEVVIW